MEEIADRFYKSYDLGGAAFAVYLANLGFRWSCKPAGLAKVKTVDELFAVRELESYEFVHLAAYLAGRQAERRGFPLVDDSDIREFTLPPHSWDRREIIPRGKVVFGVMRRHARWIRLLEDSALGISLGNGHLVSLSPGSNLSVHQTEALFPALLYKDVRFGDYDWLASQADPNGAAGARQAERIRSLGSHPLVERRPVTA